MERSLSVIKKINHKTAILNLGFLIIAAIFLSYILPSSSIDQGDGRGAKGSGIAKGGSGILGYDKLHRKGGTPPITSNPGFLNELPSPLTEKQGDYSADRKIVIVLGANIEGGVQNWKDPKEWDVERSSILDKKSYAKRHKYDLVIKDMTRKKKYSHEYREAWGKFDALRSAMKDHPKGEWFWYIDLNTLIMEPQISLEELIFSKLDTVNRDLSYFNPHAIPDDLPYMETNDQIDFLLSQDCNGFNLNSFFIRKSDWSNLLLDVIFDPVFYKQMHIKWEREEEHNLEYLYASQAWIRSRFGFFPTRKFNSLARGACVNTLEKDKAQFIYNETGRDFLVNMNNCHLLRNCYDEMEFFKSLSKALHRSWFNWF